MYMYMHTCIIVYNAILFCLTVMHTCTCTCTFFSTCKKAAITVQCMLHVISDSLSMSLSFSEGTESQIEFFRKLDMRIQQVIRGICS